MHTLLPPITIRRRLPRSRRPFPMEPSCGSSRRVASVAVCVYTHTYEKYVLYASAVWFGERRLGTGGATQLARSQPGEESGETWRAGNLAANLCRPIAAAAAGGDYLFALMFGTVGPARGLRTKNGAGERDSNCRLPLSPSISI
jgi:hypothetical protein